MLQYQECSTSTLWLLCRTAWHSCNTLSREEAQLRYVQHLQVVSPGWADQDAGSNLHGAGGQGPVFSRMADAEADSDSPVMAPSGLPVFQCIARAQQLVTLYRLHAFTCLCDIAICVCAAMSCELAHADGGGAHRGLPPCMQWLGMEI